MWGKCPRTAVGERGYYILKKSGLISLAIFLILSNFGTGDFIDFLARELGVGLLL